MWAGFTLNQTSPAMLPSSRAPTAFTVVARFVPSHPLSFFKPSPQALPSFLKVRILFPSVPPNTADVLVLLFFFFLKIYLSIYFGCSRSQLWHTGSSLWHVGSSTAAHRIFSCGMRTFSCGMHVGSSSQTRDQTQAPCTGSMESYPLDHQGSPWISLFFYPLVLQLASFKL